MFVMWQIEKDTLQMDVRKEVNEIHIVICSQAYCHSIFAFSELAGGFSGAGRDSGPMRLNWSQKLAICTR